MANGNAYCIKPIEQSYSANILFVILFFIFFYKNVNTRLIYISYIERRIATARLDSLDGLCSGSGLWGLRVSTLGFRNPGVEYILTSDTNHNPKPDLDPDHDQDPNPKL